MTEFQIHKVKEMTKIAKSIVGIAGTFGEEFQIHSSEDFQLWYEKGKVYLMIKTQHKKSTILIRCKKIMKRLEFIKKCEKRSNSEVELLKPFFRMRDTQFYINDKLATFLDEARLKLKDAM